MSEYVSIKEFAEKAGVSTQAIYARLAKDLQPYLKIENGKKSVSIEALALFNTEEQQPNLPNDLQLALKCLQAQLEVKDKQIEELTKALLNEQHSAQQAHALHAGTMQRKVIEDKLPKVNFFAKWFKKRGTNFEVCFKDENG